MTRLLPLWLGLAIGLLTSCAAAADDSDRIQPCAKNPRYWQYRTRRRANKPSANGPRRPPYIMFDCEIMQDLGGLPDPADLPGTISIDYLLVRPSLVLSPLSCGKMRPAAGQVRPLKYAVLTSRR